MSSKERIIFNMANSLHVIFEELLDAGCHDIESGESLCWAVADAWFDRDFGGVIDAE